MQPTKTKIAITGAFSYSGKYIAQRLLASGCEVITLTNHPQRPNPFGHHLKAYAYRFNDSAALAASLESVKVLINTYWVRFNHGTTTYEAAVANTRKLLTAAKTAGVERFVHTSITNPSRHSPLAYFRCKAWLEDDVRRSGLSYAIIRPTVIFGREDILINNIAYLLRRSPFFAVPGSGEYKLQPVYVEDFAEIVEQAALARENLERDAVGPDTFTYRDLVAAISLAVRSKTKIVSLPPGVLWTLARLLGLFLGDVVLTRDEIRGLMAGLLVSDQPPSGSTHLSAWLQENHATLGNQYASELARHYR